MLNYLLTFLLLLSPQNFGLRMMQGHVTTITVNGTVYPFVTGQKITIAAGASSQVVTVNGRNLGVLVYAAAGGGSGAHDGTTGFPSAGGGSGAVTVAGGLSVTLLLANSYQVSVGSGGARTSGTNGVIDANNAGGETNLYNATTAAYVLRLQGATGVSGGSVLSGSGVAGVSGGAGGINSVGAAGTNNATGAGGGGGGGHDDGGNYAGGAGGTGTGSTSGLAEAGQSGPSGGGSPGKGAAFNGTDYGSGGGGSSGQLYYGGRGGNGVLIIEMVN